MFCSSFNTCINCAYVNISGSKFEELEDWALFLDSYICKRHIFSYSMSFFITTLILSFCDYVAQYGYHQMILYQANYEYDENWFFENSPGYGNFSALSLLSPQLCLKPHPSVEAVYECEDSWSYNDSLRWCYLYNEGSVRCHCCCQTFFC